MKRLGIQTAIYTAGAFTAHALSVGLALDSVWSTSAGFIFGVAASSAWTVYQQAKEESSNAQS